MAAAAGLGLVVACGLSAFAFDVPRPAPDGATDTYTMVLDDHRVQPILGREVRGSSGEAMGRIVDVIVDGRGRPRAAIIDFGGFLGVGSRKIVVDWNALQFGPDTGPVGLALTRDQVKAAPEYRNGKPVVVMGALIPPAGPDM
jgi:hypothetical protein